MPNHTAGPIAAGSTIDITADVNQAVNALRTIDAFLKRTQRTVRSFNRDLDRSPDIDTRASVSNLRSLNTSLQRTNVFVGSLLANFATNLFQRFGEQVVGAAIELNALRERFIALNETAEIGAASFERIFETAQELGAPFDAVLAGAVRLRNYGFESAQEIESLTRTITVLSGGSAMAVERLVRALSQVVGSGRVAQEELNQFSEIIPIINSIAEVTGIAQGRIRELVAARDQAINPEVIIAALRNLEQGTFGRAAEAQAQTVAAAINRVTNQIKDLTSNLVEILEPVAEGVLKKLNDNFGIISGSIIEIVGLILGAKGLKAGVNYINNRVISSFSKLSRESRETSNRLRNLGVALKDRKFLVGGEIARIQSESLRKTISQYDDLATKGKGLGNAFRRLGLIIKDTTGLMGFLIKASRGVGNLFKILIASAITLKGSLITLGVTAVASIGAMISSLRRADKEINNIAVRADENLGVIGKLWFAVGDAINTAIYAPLRETDFLGQIKQLRTALSQQEGDIINLRRRGSLQLLSREQAKKELDKLTADYENFIRKIYQINNEAVNKGGPFNFMFLNRGVPELEQWQTDLLKFLKEYNDVALDIYRRDLFGLFADQTDKFANEINRLRSRLSAIRRLLTNIAENSAFIDPDQVRGYINLIGELEKRIKDLEIRREIENLFKSYKDSVASTFREGLFGLLEEEGGALETQINTVQRIIGNLERFLTSAASNLELPVDLVREYVALLKQYNKDLKALEIRKLTKDLLEDYDKAVAATALRRTLGLITNEAEVYRQSISNVEALINGFIEEDIPLDQIKDAVGYLIYARKKLDEITKEREPNERLDALRNIRSNVASTLTDINTQYEIGIRYARNYNELEEEITNKIEQQYSIYKSTLAELNNLLATTSKLNPAYAIILSYIDTIRVRLSEIGTDLPRTTDAVKDLRTEFEKFFNIDTSTGFGEFLGPDSELGRALKSVDKVLEVVQRVGSAIGSLMNTITQTISNLVNRQVQQMQDKLDALAESRQKAEEEFRRQLQKEEEGLRRQFEAGIITFENYYSRLDQVRKNDENKRNELRNKEIDLENKINLARHQAAVDTFNINKALSIAQVLFNTASAILRAFADFPAPVAAGIATAIGVLSGAQIGLISSQQPPPPPRIIDKLAEGGIITRRQYVEVGEGVKPNKELIMPLNKKTLQKYGLGGGPNITVIYKGTVIEEKQAAKTLEGILKKNIQNGRIGSLR